MPPSANERFAILNRRKKVADLYLRGKSQWQIARDLDIGQATVSRDFEALRDDWRKTNWMRVDELQQRELAKIDLIEAEAWNAWERSKENRERTTKQRESGEAAVKSKVVVMTEGRLPENEFLKSIQWCITKRCEILGLDAAKKFEHSVRIEAMTEADKLAMIDGIAARLGAMADDRAHEDDGSPTVDDGTMADDFARGSGLGAGGAGPD